MTRDEAKEIIENGLDVDYEKSDERIDEALETVLNSKPVIDKDDTFRIGMNLHKLSLYLKEPTYKVVKPWLTEIENIVYKYTEAGQAEKERSFFTAHPNMRLPLMLTRTESSRFL